MSKKNTGTIWWAGFASHMAISSLAQDAHGKEEMIRLIAYHWIDAKITVPIAIAVMIYANHRNKKAKEAIDATTFELIEPSSRHSAHRAYNRRQHTNE